MVAPERPAPAPASQWAAREPGAVVRADAPRGEGRALSTQPADYDGRPAPRAEESGPGEAVAGFLAASSMALSFVAMVYRPVRLAPFALVVALIAVGLGGRHARLATLAVVIAVLGWLVGMTGAVVTEKPLW